jgi:DNA repair exonuclease SbcCD ATPase subunit
MNKLKIANINNNDFKTKSNGDKPHILSIIESTVDTMKQLYDNGPNNDGLYGKSYGMLKSLINDQQKITDKLIKNNDDIIEYIKNLEIFYKNKLELKTQLTKNNYDLKKLKEYTQSISELKYKIKIYTIYKETVSVSGLTFQLISKCMPQIQDNVNNIIKQFEDYSIKLDYYIKGKGDTLKEDMEIKILRNNEKSYSAGLVSGFENVMINICFRTICTKILMSPGSNMFIMDEVLAYADARRRDDIVTLLDVLKQYHDVIVLISHDSVTRSAVDQVYTVKKTMRKNEKKYSHINIS